MKRNATSRPPPEGALQEVRRGCTDLGQQVEGIAEQVVPVLRQAIQEMGRLEAQRDELRKTASRDAPPVVLPRLLERIEEQGQYVKRLERASRGLKELLSALGGMDEQLQEGLARQDEERREQTALVREEKRLWLRELLTLRQRVGGTTPPSEEPHRPEGEETVRLRAERDGLAQRVEELERELASREQALDAKEQTLADLRLMIVLLSGDKAATPPPPQPLTPPIAIPVVAAPARSTPARGRQAVKAPDQMFGNSTMALAHSMLETLGEDAEPSAESFATATRAPSMEIMLGPLDELEAGSPSAPPPVPAVLPSANQPAMAKAGARVPAPDRPSTSVSEPPRPPLDRSGTLVISEDMFSDMLVDENPPPTGRK